MNRLMTIVCLTIGIATGIWGITPQEISSAYYRSYNYEKMGNISDAIKALMPVYRAYSSGYTVNLRLGYLYFQNGQFANAVTHYQTAIQLAPDSLEPKQGLLQLKLALGLYDEAVVIANRIIHDDPNNYLANLRLAYALRLGKQYEASERVCIKLLTLYPTDVGFLNEYGASKLAQGEVGLADSVFKDVLILDPENVDARFFLGKSATRLDKKKTVKQPKAAKKKGS